MKKKLLFLAVVLSIAFVSCKKDKSDPTPPASPYKGVFVLNEGTFTYANSSLSFYDPVADTAANNLFFRVNHAPIGDVGQSLAKYNGSLYIVVNNSKYIYKINANTLLYQAKLEGFNSPRYMLTVGNDKAYVSDLERTGIWVIDLSDFSHKKFIETGNTTEAMVKVGNEVFVTNWSNYYTSGETSNKTVQVIDCQNDELVDEIEVAQEPNSMVVDKHNNIWVLCSGSNEGVQDPALICIDPATKTVIKRFDFTPGMDYPSGLAVDKAGQNIYFMNGGYGTLNVYKMSIEAEQVPETPFIVSESKVFYSIKVDPTNDEVYISNAKNYVMNGDVERYSASGEFISKFEAGIIPSYMLFNY